MALNPYLHFNGECREAFEFYSSVFGSEFITMMTFQEGPEDLDIADGDLDRIMHVSLPIGSAVLMGSDTGSSVGPPPKVGNNFSLCFETGERSHADEVFAKLSNGGKVMMPMGDVFWGSYYGKCTDKFGITWDIMACPTQE